MDWHTHALPTWRLSNYPAPIFSVEALEEPLVRGRDLRYFRSLVHIGVGLLKRRHGKILTGCKFLPSR
jgi:hypothetical protein